MRMRAVDRTQTAQPRLMVGRRKDRIQISDQDKRHKATARTSLAPSVQKVRKTLRRRERRDNRPGNEQSLRSLASAAMTQISKMGGSRRANPQRDRADKAGRRKRPRRVEANERLAMAHNVAGRVAE